MTGRSDEARAILARHALGARAYSPTALENYAACPYRFFLQAIQGLAPRQVPEAIDELDPLSRGSLIHDIQFELFARLRDAGLLPVHPANLQRAQSALDDVIATSAAQYRDDLAPAIERIWDDAVAGIRADLREWLRRASEDAFGYVPMHFELSFGLTRRHERRQADPRSVADAVELDCGIQLRGSIDLVEQQPHGDIRVTDHKTGKASVTRRQRIGGGTSLQPVLYALAAEKLFAGEASVSAGRLYFCTSNGGFIEHAVPLDDLSRNAALTVAQTIGEAINSPFLPAAPAERTWMRPQACQHCDYRKVCGPHEERRTGLKKRERLEPLLDLRSKP
jgi:ATP-dependent helicase/DNAse subunit B